MGLVRLAQYDARTAPLEILYEAVEYPEVAAAFAGFAWHRTQRSTLDVLQVYEQIRPHPGCQLHQRMSVEESVTTWPCEVSRPGAARS